MIAEPREQTNLYASLETVPSVRLISKVSQVLFVRWWLSLLIEAYRVTRKPRLRPPKATRTR